MKKSLKNLFCAIIAISAIGLYTHFVYQKGKTDERTEVTNKLENTARYISNTSKSQNLNDSISTEYFFQDFNLAADYIKGKANNDMLKNQLKQRANNNPKY